MNHVKSIAPKVYYTGTYAHDHWAMKPYHLTDPKVIDVLSYKNMQYAIYMNPTDKRGYRMIVRLISNDDMASTFNREYSPDERMGLKHVMELIEHVFRSFVPIVQTFLAGNISHRFDPKTGITYIGHADEPSFLHAHVIGRGNPEEKIIADVKLDGPVPGLNFDMMAKTLNEPGNDKKVKWNEEEMARVVNVLRKELIKVKQEHEFFKKLFD